MELLKIYIKSNKLKNSSHYVKGKKSNHAYIIVHTIPVAVPINGYSHQKTPVGLITQIRIFQTQTHNGLSSIMVQIQF